MQSCITILIVVYPATSSGCLRINLACFGDGFTDRSLLVIDQSRLDPQINWSERRCAGGALQQGNAVTSVFGPSGVRALP